MSVLWAGLTMVGVGLFVGGVVFIAWERVPAWRQTPPTDFSSAFTYTLRRVDRLQPVLLAVLIVATIGFAATTGGMARTLSVVAAAGFLVILVGSAAWLVPIQRRLTSGTAPDVERLRTRWLRAHQIRAVAALALYIVAIVAAAI